MKKMLKNGLKNSSDNMEIFKVKLLKWTLKSKNPLPLYAFQVMKTQKKHKKVSLVKHFIVFNFLIYQILNINTYFFLNKICK